MHDEVGTSLTQIALLADLMQAERGADANAERLATVADISRQTVASMEELVWAVTPANDTLGHLIGYIGPWVNQTLDRFGIHCVVESPATVADVPASAEFRRNILLVIKEAVSNVVEHSKATEVRLVIACDGGRLRLVLTDNGAGIHPSSQRVGYGLANMRRRAEDLGGTCRITAGPEGGAVIALDSPLPSSTGALS
ncbi:MAG: ATP-binding protein [Planctomycetia bacterium]|nr:ATP-binding protein [Planctomycetia bacterium]